MSIKLTDTQIAMLNAAARRADRCLVAPRNLKGGAAQKVAAKPIDGGLAKEIKAKRGAPVWRQDEQAGLSFALKLTAAGARAIAIDDSSASRYLLRLRLLRALSFLQFSGSGDCWRIVALSRRTSNVVLAQPGTVRRSSFLVGSVDRHRMAALAPSRKGSARGMREPVRRRDQFF
jgi:hypothetical protein